jgi:flagellin-like hook-associated protein FlgL
MYTIFFYLIFSFATENMSLRAINMQKENTSSALRVQRAADDASAYSIAN